MGAGPGIGLARLSALAALVVALGLTSGPAGAGEIEVSPQAVADAVAKAVSVPADRLDLIVSPLPELTTDRIAVVATRQEGTRTLARIVVLAADRSSAVAPIGVSREFDLADASSRTSFERPDTYGTDRARIQVNLRSACGVASYRYLFRQQGQVWRLIGFDAEEPACAEDGQVGIGREVSVNHATGKASELVYQGDKPPRRRSWKHQGKPVTFDNFDPFSADTGYRP